MEQHIGPKSPPPVPAAATDPSYVPGLMPPRAETPAADAPEPAGPAEGAAPERTEESAQPKPEPAQSEPAQSEPGSAGRAAPDGDAAEPESTPGPEAAPAPADTARESEDERAAVDDPAFEVSDRRSVIIANRAGMVLRLDDQEAEFDWTEIGAVEFQTSKYGRRLTVFVHLPNRHTYQADVTAPGRGELKEWSARLDTVLDTYFEE
ncbi:hypothetical protein G3I19_09515 [Streptomyces sp. SID10853]|uniref:hypothetical protein n=1 Tax=Streptomyces sp. SID10853 TaxID=2706028 RepID=UPI0013C22FCE|nr:hypothetical protein [Streptomyces sp. SID10853]NDZ78758.1 hypothetical protein [Streptomyces sp. SID10853]